MALFKKIFGRGGQKSKSPAGGSQQGFHLEAISEEANMGKYILDGSNTQTTKQEIAWLQLRLTRGEREKFAEFGRLTPGLAQLLLARNEENRPLRDGRAEGYAKDIIAGNWELNGESVTISSCGQLNDGQHRCRAVILSAIPIDVLFVFGVTHESRKTTDQGAAKTAGDYLGMDGIKNANNIASIANLLIQIEQHGRYTANMSERPTKTEVRHRCESDADIATSFSEVRKPLATKVASYSVLGTCHYIFAKKSRDSADEFMRRLITGTDMSDRDPIYVAREKLTDPYRRLKTAEKLKCIFMAWNNWRQGKRVKTLTHAMKGGERLPEVK